MRNNPMRACIAVAIVVSSVAAPAAERAESDIPDFDRVIRPLLQAKCFECHSDPTREASLDLRTVASIIAGGESGTALVPGKPDESSLLQKIVDGEMPPEGKDSLSESDVATLRSWIENGDFTHAKNASEPWRRRLEEGKKHWSFQPVRAPAVPKPSSYPERVVNPIDAFILDRLEKEKLEPAPLADRVALIRRATFDLLGLPPSPEEIRAFIEDRDHNAWEKLINRLLESPHYGERWARHWLDVARYADTGGYETDLYFKNAWRYRDYVVRAFNSDRPYDRFVQEQVAGDELWPDDLDLDGSYVMAPAKVEHFESRLGTGFYALATQIHESNMDGKKIRNEQLTDWVDATGAAFLGLTVGCARCHDHKSDPISQRDYYSLQAVFAGSKEVDVPIINAMEIADHKQFYPRILAVVEARTRFREFEKSVSGREPTEEEKQTLQSLRLAIADAVLALPERGGSAPNSPWDGLMEIPTATVLGHVDPSLIKETKLLNRGDLSKPSDVMSPAIPELLADVTESSALLPGPIGSRKELALWLTKADNPLTARVMVNRIWHWHFGNGIVSTPGDFGKMGQAPSHPELLDWLATEFVARGWSIKELHRLIMLTSTYRQSSRFGGSRHMEADPNNRLLWRMNRRRLEGEAIWDAMHASAGTLNREMGGRPVMPPLSPDELTDKAQWTVSADPAQHNRRGIYILVRRNFTFPLFATFDAPVSAVSCAARDVTTVAPQALWMMNNKTPMEQATHLAARLVREAGADRKAQIQRAWLITLSRDPTAEEMGEAEEFMDAFEIDDQQQELPAIPKELDSLPPQRARAIVMLCLTLFNTSEFVFVD